MEVTVTRAGAKAPRTKGLVIVNTGDGKGKTTAALGIALRACGYAGEVIIMVNFWNFALAS